MGLELTIESEVAPSLPWDAFINYIPFFRRGVH